jgi:hypothetical protein
MLKLEQHVLHISMNTNCGRTLDLVGPFIILILKVFSISVSLYFNKAVQFLQDLK